MACRPETADAAARQALVAATFDGAPDGIVVLGAQGEPLAFNARFQALWNFPPELLAAGDVPRLREYTAQPLALVVRWRDVTARRQVQSRLAAIFELASNAILLADNEGRYIDANPAACALLGFSRDELLALRVADVVVADSVQLQGQWASFLNQQRQKGCVQLRRASGELLMAQFAAVANVQPGVHLSMLTDVTEEERASSDCKNWRRCWTWRCWARTWPIGMPTCSAATCTR